MLIILPGFVSDVVGLLLLLPPTRALVRRRILGSAAQRVPVRLAPGAAEIIDALPSGRLYKDGALLIDAEARTVAARRRLSFSGIVSVALAMNDKGALVADPEVELIGLPEVDASGASMTEAAQRAVEEAFEALPKPRRRDPNEVSESIRRAVRGAIAERWNKTPVCHVHVLVTASGLVKPSANAHRQRRQE